MDSAFAKTRTPEEEHVSPDRPNLRWHEAIGARHSRRRHVDRPIESETADTLRRHCEDFRPFDGIRAVMADAPQDVFTGVLGPVGSYGSVRGAPALLAFVGPEGRDVEVGYVGEAAVLEATALGLATCWVAGTFDRELAHRTLPLEAGEHVHAVTPVGYAQESKRGSERTLARVLGARLRKDEDEIAPGLDDSWPGWAREAVDAARLAPSGANRQPWRFRMDENALVLSLAPGKTYWTRGLDCGCALLHAELGAAAAGERVRVRIVEPDLSGSDFEGAPDVAFLEPVV
jgi:hypothetical protein